MRTHVHMYFYPHIRTHTHTPTFSFLKGIERVDVLQLFKRQSSERRLDCGLQGVVKMWTLLWAGMDGATLQGKSRPQVPRSFTEVVRILYFHEGVESVTPACLEILGSSHPAASDWEYCCKQAHEAQ